METPVADRTADVPTRPAAPSIDVVRDDVIQADLYFIEKIGMNKVIGSQRSNGLTAMIKQIKLYALAYKAKLQQQI